MVGSCRVHVTLQCIQDYQKSLVIIIISTFSGLYVYQATDTMTHPVL